MSGDAVNNANGNGTPAWLKFATQFGVPALLCVGLVYWITLDAGAKLTATQNETMQTRSMMLSHVDASGRINSELLFYVRQICIQNALATRQKPESCVFRVGREQ